jgi:hypothetical protein
MLSTHSPLAQIVPGPQVCRHPAGLGVGLHREERHLLSLGHAAPHAPQLAESVPTSTQDPPQQVPYRGPLPWSGAKEQAKPSVPGGQVGARQRCVWERETSQI